MNLQTGRGARQRWPGSGATATPTSLRSDFVEVADHLGPGERAESHLRGASPCRSSRLRRQRLARAGAGGHDAAPVDRPRLLQLVSPAGDDPGVCRRPRPAGSTVVFEVVVDDYAEVWVNGQLPLTLGLPGGQVVSGFNAPNRVVLGTDVRPGPDLHRRRVRHQRPDLGGSRQLHLDAERDARLLPSGPGGGGRVRTAGLVVLDAETGADPRPASPRSSALPAASSSPKDRSGTLMARCSSAPRTPTPSTGGRRPGSSASFGQRVATRALT